MFFDIAIPDADGYFLYVVAALRGNRMEDTWSSKGVSEPYASAMRMTVWGLFFAYLYCIVLNAAWSPDGWVSLADGLGLGFLLLLAGGGTLQSKRVQYVLDELALSISPTYLRVRTRHNRLESPLERLSEIRLWRLRDGQVVKAKITTLNDRFIVVRHNKDLDAFAAVLCERLPDHVAVREVVRRIHLTDMQKVLIATAPPYLAVTGWFVWRAWGGA